jgi:hypothetical protein
MSKAEIKRQILKLHDEKVDLAYPEYEGELFEFAGGGNAEIR